MLQFSTYMLLSCLLNNKPKILLSCSVLLLTAISLEILCPFFTEHPQFLELPGDFGYSELHLFFPKFRQQATKFAWMAGDGLHCYLCDCAVYFYLWYVLGLYIVCIAHSQTPRADGEWRPVVNPSVQSSRPTCSQSSSAQWQVHIVWWADSYVHLFYIDNEFCNVLISETQWYLKTHTQRSVLTASLPISLTHSYTYIHTYT